MKSVSQNKCCLTTDNDLIFTFKVKAEVIAQLCLYFQADPNKPISLCHPLLGMYAMPAAKFRIEQILDTNKLSSLLEYLLSSPQNASPVCPQQQISTIVDFFRMAEG